MYEYRCQSCGAVFEVIQKFSDEPLKVHEGCGGEVERLLSAPALQFKGSGWYITDYAKSSKSSDRPAAKSESGGESKTETKTESKSDSPAPASPAKSD